MKPDYAETFGEMNARIKAEVQRDEIAAGVVHPFRVVGTACEPRLVPRRKGDRYCAMCDAWMRPRVCKACGLDTEKGHD